MEQTYYYYTLQELYLVPAKYYNMPSSWDYFYHPIQDDTYGMKILTELNGDADTKYLVQPLMNRWSNSHIALVKTDKELKFYNEGALVANLSDSNKAMSRIWSKLNDILPIYKELYKRYNAMLTAIDSDSGLSNEATTTSTSRHNDTPNANNDYSAETFTSDITSNTSTSKQTNNKLDDYDAIRARIENLPQQIINEMKVFEIWI